MIEIKCPDVDMPTGDTVFLAGGISNCPNWQKIIVQMLGDTDLILFNPLREDYDYNDPNVEEEQIKWEFLRINVSEAVLFWFPCETVCPITLYELGKMSGRFCSPIFVGTHPDYKRKSDVAIQMKLARSEVVIVHSLRDLAKQVRAHFFKFY